MSTSPPPSPLLAPSTAPEDEGLPLEALCPICYRRPPIYTCPGCFSRSCSVACVKKHKNNRRCSGERNPTKYVKRSKLMTETGVNRDFNFLTGLEKTISKASEVLPEMGKEVREEGEMVREKRVRMTKEAKENFHKVLKERGTEVKWAPWEGFERAKENFSRINKNSQKILWTVEWILVDYGNRRLREHDITETTTLHDAKLKSKLLPEEIRKQKGVKYFLILQSPANVKRCTQIERTESIKEALRMQTVMEYPDILVSTHEKPEGWELIPRKIMEIKEPREKKQDHETGKKRKRNHGNGPAQYAKDVIPSIAENTDAAMVEVEMETESKVEEIVEAPEMVPRLEGRTEETFLTPILPEVDIPSGMSIQKPEGPSEEPIEPVVKKVRIEHLE